MIQLNAIASEKNNLTSSGDERAPRMSVDESRRIGHSRRVLFDKMKDGKVEVWAGEYYAVLKEGLEEIGIVISNRYSPRLVLADEKLLIGRVGRSYGLAGYFPKQGA